MQILLSIIEIAIQMSKKKKPLKNSYIWRKYLNTMNNYYSSRIRVESKNVKDC